MAKTSPTQADDPLFTAIAREYLLVDTLSLHGRDHLDFHSVSVIGIRRALMAAYEAGRACGGSPPPAADISND